MPLMPVLRQRQADLPEFEFSLVLIRVPGQPGVMRPRLVNKQTIPVLCWKCGLVTDCSLSMCDTTKL